MNRNGLVRYLDRAGSHPKWLAHQRNQTLSAGMGFAQPETDKVSAETGCAIAEMNNVSGGTGWVVSKTGCVA